MTLDTNQEPPGYGLDARGLGGVSSIDALDKRTRPYRRYMAIRAAVLSDMGSEANVTEVQKQLVSKFCTLCLQLETLESVALEGGQIDLDLFGRCSGHLRRIAETLGLNRVPKNVTPSVAEYIECINEAGAEEAGAA